MIIRPYNPTARHCWFYKKRRRGCDAFSHILQIRNYCLSISLYSFTMLFTFAGAKRP